MKVLSPFGPKIAIVKIPKKIINNINFEVDKITSFPEITTSEDLKKSASFAYVEPVAFKDQYILPLLDFIPNKSPVEVRATICPSFEIAVPRKLCDFINDDIDLISQTFAPFSISILLGRSQALFVNILCSIWGALLVDVDLYQTAPNIL
mgnify:CR=1 FL=1